MLGLLVPAAILVLSGLLVSKVLPDPLALPALLVQWGLLALSARRAIKEWSGLRALKVTRDQPVRWAQRARQVQRERKAL